MRVHRGNRLQLYQALSPEEIISLLPIHLRERSIDQQRLLILIGLLLLLVQYLSHSAYLVQLEPIELWFVLAAALLCVGARKWLLLGGAV